jgi:hypothetical protein
MSKLAYKRKHERGECSKWGCHEQHAAGRMKCEGHLEWDRRYQKLMRHYRKVANGS